MAALAALIVYAGFQNDAPKKSPQKIDEAQAVVSDSQSSQLMPSQYSDASIVVTQTEEEKRFLGSHGCTDDVDCYGPKKFEKDMKRRYSDIGKYKFRPWSDLNGDREETEIKRQDFVRGLYFAKQITLANGQTLFEFLTKCSNGQSPLNSAEFAYQPISHEPYFYQIGRAHV